MEKLLKYKKQIVIAAIAVLLSVIMFGVYILQTSLNNITYSKNEAHLIALNKFPGTVTSSEIEYENLQVFYEIKILTQKQELIDITISAKSGEIIAYEYE